MIPAHIQAILSGKIHARPVAPIVGPAQRTPVFEPSHHGSAPRTDRRTKTMRAVEECTELDVHDIGDPRTNMVDLLS